VTELPVPPAAVATEFKFGRSVIMLPDANGVIPQPPAPGEPVIGGIDKDWITQMFKLCTLKIVKRMPQLHPPYRTYR
jgi:hypothetical protein